MPGTCSEGRNDPCSIFSKRRLKSDFPDHHQRSHEKAPTFLIENGKLRAGFLTIRFRQP
jgi:hypothetical protein